MVWLKGLVVILVLGAVFFWGILFATENTQLVTLSLVFWTFPQASVSVWVASGFALGAVLGLLVSLFLIVKLNAGQVKVKRQLSQCQQELDKLRAHSS